ncbi:MAG TPA: 2-dehydropantoate 2-reductase [Bauldia sp.]|nr:2-dehydropantoate 2-reductase [Bauldia sp.]
MRIAVIGAGAMGAMFGARFAGAGAEVVLFDKDAEHVSAINAEGLTVEGRDGALRLRLPATTDPAAIGVVDMALVMVDGNATAAVAGMLAAMLPPAAFALTLQNGIGNVEALSAALGGSRVVAGSTYNSGARVGPGVVAHTNVGETTIGELDGRPSGRLGEVAALFEGGGLPVTVSDNVFGHIWMKFVLNVAINPVSAVTGLRPGEIARTPPALALMEHVLDEALAVIAAKGIRLPHDDPRAHVIDHAWARYNRPSMLQHVEAGRRTEIDSLNGALVREAAALRIPCPFNEAIVLTVKSLEARAALRAATRDIDEAALEAEARTAPRPR